MVLGKLPVPGHPTILITVGQGPIALAVGAGGGGLDIFIRPFIRPFEKRSYYVIPPGVRLSVRPSVCKLFRFRVTPPTVYVRLS